MRAPMPELPEVETVRQGLLPLVGHIVQSVEVRHKTLRTPLDPALGHLLAGATLTALDRRAKYLLFRFDHQKTLLVHLGMSGRIRLLAHDSGERLLHDHVVVHFTDGRCFIFNDARRFGLVEIYDSLTVESILALGPEPLEKGFTPKIFHAALKRKKQPIKLALLDQKIVAGVGNIYACEALYRARISPFRRAESLQLAEVSELISALKSVLKAALASGGSSLRDHFQTNGESGYFQHQFLVYDREGVSCSQCQSRITADVVTKSRRAQTIGTITRTPQGGRSTFWCSVCQK